MNATIAAKRQELHCYIDAIPDRNLDLVIPLLSYLADEPLIIETSLTGEERAVIAEGDKRFKEHPEDFISLDDYLVHGAYYTPPEPEKQVWRPK